MWYKIIQLLFYPILQVDRAVGGVQLVAGTHCDGVIVAATWLHLSHLSPPYCSNLLQSLLHVCCSHCCMCSHSPTHCLHWTYIHYNLLYPYPSIT